MKEIMTSLIPDPEYFGESMGNDIWAYTEDQLVDYGKACREAALEEAAGVCIVIAIAPSNCILGAAMNCADAIRKLK